MSYQVIARRWRSQSFDDLVGQKHISQMILNSLRNDRLPHALLFCGPRGVGKTSTARILAKSLRCPNAKDFNACNTCKSCEEVMQGHGIDVLEIDGASNNGVDAIRELRDTVSYMPSSGKYKVYIIDEVHMLSTSAFNALLKTLEEPPAHVKFIFATTEPQKVPLTVLGRCQRFDFRRIPTRDIVNHLKHICQSEGVTAEDSALWTIARLADGSMRDGQGLLDQSINYCDKNITDKKIAEVLGLTDRALLNDTLKALTERNLKKTYQLVEHVFSSGLDAKIFAQDLLELTRHLLMVKLSTEKSAIVDLAEGDVTFLKNLGATLSEEEIHGVFDMLLKGVSDLARSSSQRIVLEMLLLRVASSPRIVEIKKLLASVTSGQVVVSAQNPPAATAASGVNQKNSSPAVVTPAATMTSAGGNNSQSGFNNIPLASKTSSSSPSAEGWAQFVSKVKGLQPALGAKLDYAAFLSIENSTVRLGYKKAQEFLYNQVIEPKSVTMIQNYLQTFWGPGLKVNIQLLSDAEGALSPKAKEEITQQQKKSEIQKDVENHPLVQKAQKTFKVQIQEIKENK